MIRTCLRRAMPIALAVILSTPAAIAAPPPRAGVARIDDLPKPLPLPYAEQADADRAVAAARARAGAAGKKLLIDLGGNWCLDCRILAAVIELPQVKRFVARHYEIVTVDVGRFDKNGQIAARYGIKGRLEGVPSVLVVDPRTDRLLNAGHTSALADARSLTPQAIADWLAQWT